MLELDVVEYTNALFGRTDCTMLVTQGGVLTQFNTIEMV
jgi:hypothetical protein